MFGFLYKFQKFPLAPSRRPLWGRQEELKNGRVPCVWTVPPVYGHAPLPGADHWEASERRGLLSSVQSGWAGPLESRCPEAMAPWFRVMQRGSTFHSFNFNPPSFSHFYLHCLSSCTRLVAGNAVCLCPLPWVCMPGFAICLRLSLPP